MRKTVLVGSTCRFGITGAGVAFDMLVSGFGSRRLPVAVVDLASRGPVRRPGTFDLRRAVCSLATVIAYWASLLRAGQVYITIASSRLGFLRDALMIWPARLCNCRVALHLHGGGYPDFCDRQPGWLKWFICATLKQADAIVVLGELLRGQFAFAPALATKVRVVPNGAPFASEPGVSEGKTLPSIGAVRVLYLSNMIESKGYLDLLQACRILHCEYGLPLRCEFCGAFLSTAVDEAHHTPDEARARFLDLVRAWGLEDVVSYHGVVTGGEKLRMLRRAHLFVLPTWYAWEGQPISIVEALAFGIPVIATDYRGIPEQVIDGYNGRLVQPRSPRQLAEAILGLCEDPGLYQQMSLKAILHFQESFTQEAHLERLIPIILG